jgi:hypothetical protein
MRFSFLVKNGFFVFPHWTFSEAFHIVTTGHWTGVRVKLIKGGYFHELILVQVGEKSAKSIKKEVYSYNMDYGIKNSRIG